MSFLVKGTKRDGGMFPRLRQLGSGAGSWVKQRSRPCALLWVARTLIPVSDGASSSFFPAAPPHPSQIHTKKWIHHSKTHGTCSPRLRSCPLAECRVVLPTPIPLLIACTDTSSSAAAINDLPSSWWLEPKAK